MSERIERVEVHLLGDGDWIHVETLCRLSGLDLNALIELADLGVVAPRGYAPEEWQLAATTLPRLRTVGRLIRDLGVNVSGAALVVELLERQHRLERRLHELEQHFRDVS